MPSRAFGEYEVLARLATGGAANIFLARHGGARPPDRRLVCLKTLLPDRARDRDFVDMFLDEARLASRLEHPNCVQLYGFGKAELTYYLAMEYIAGETIWGLLTNVAELRRPLPPVFVATVMAAALEGLHAAHELTDEEGRSYQIVHRDISPQNVMVTYEGRTKLLDFGIAKAETGRQATATGIVKGKFSYMSPEQITGGALDRRSDIYSVGIVLFECLASRRLYKSESPEEIARMMLERRPPRLREVNGEIAPALEDICATALARHAKARFATAAEMARALRSYVESEGHDGSEREVAALLEERLGAKIAGRRRLLEELRSGRYDESELYSVLGASPALDLDFRPGFSADETMGEGGPLDASGGAAAEESERELAALEASGFRIQLERVKAARPSALVREVPVMSLPRTTSHGVSPARARADSDVLVTVFEPERPSPEATQEEHPAALPRDTVSNGAAGPGEGAVQVSEEFEEDTDARWTGTEVGPEDELAPAVLHLREGVLSRAASFIEAEVTDDTSPSLRPAPAALLVASAPVVTPGAAPSRTPAAAPVTEPPLAPPLASAPSLASADRAPALVPRGWVLLAFAGGLGLGLGLGLALAGR